MSNPLTGIDADSEAAINELERLLRALKDNDAHIQTVEHSGTADVGEISTETLTIQYTLTDEFDGIDPLQYTNRGEYE